jgi:dTDP-4-amino-4,6-dideoxygalactose transaminase
VEKGIKTEIHYPVPPNKQEGYSHLFENDFPISDNIHQMELSLPISAFHTEEDIAFVTQQLNSY